MKSFAVILAAATLAYVNAAACDLLVVAPLLQDVDVKQCTADSGFQAPIPPTAAQMPKVCASKACSAALAKLKALNLGDCTIGSLALESGLIKPIEKACSATPTTAPTTAPTTGPTSGPTTAPTTGPNPTKGPTTAPTTKPGC